MMRSLIRPSPFDPGASFALVADDTPMVLAAMKTFLENQGFVVLTARDGVEAVELAPLFPFSLIVTDIDMPHLDGLTAVKCIRTLGGALESVRKVPYDFLCLAILRNMRRIIASRRKASAVRERFSKSLERRRHRPSHPKVRSTIQRLGSTSNPFAVSERLTISRCHAPSSRTAAAVAAPW